MVKQEHLRVAAQHVPFLARALRLAWQATPVLTSIWMSLLVLQGLLPVVAIYTTKLAIDSITAVLGLTPDWVLLQPSIMLVLIVATLLLLSDLLQIVVDWLRSVQAEYIQDHVAELVQNKALGLDIAFFESPDFHDRLDQVRSEASGRTRALLETLGTLIQNAITLLGLSVAIAQYGVILPIVLFISVLPAFVVVVRTNRQYHQWWQGSTPDRRRVQYYDMMMTHSTAVPEVRAYNLGPYFRAAYQTLRGRLRNELLTQVRRQSLARFGAGALGFIVGGGVMTWILYRALIGSATLGDFVLFYQVFGRGQGAMRAFLSNAGQLYGHTLFIKNLFSYLALTPTISDPPQPASAPQNIRKEVCFHDVTFRYPDCEQAALNRFNLTIPAGQVVAVVGPNGAGKSTMVKLIERFYDPEAGTITIDGVDIRTLRQSDLRRLITVLFQFPLPYHASAAENISYGDVEKAVTQAHLDVASQSAGAYDLINRLPNGYDTYLGKWFTKGSELSGGEWQRIATARAYYRSSPMIVLDEPTSAMDSWAEADWFERLRCLAQGRTALVITHRFTIAMRADVIHVMDGGRIVESGTHEQLLSLAGLYAYSWKAQVEASVGEAAEAAVGQSIGPIEPNAEVLW